ncbi:MAG: menaquinone biosynthesis decarboxylase [Candidatus Glassbacteria bacterium RIFCSPLOWO2_12_FULL_58_11]|uniref:Menaquinone biosynthesis decarboxylase n=1 Tax=Candidatus Glassbacteria bacterium RIFCSPLOWO2_12_FULL_58_11 TaxID=1817867 RepID=A0A1F5YXN1_9BACT|nr:MAG: menaquinone biosynthesis decarboxylase [Candidatus Glassbacteria bacterium RIFCSPLOWO2_12_FULL_58_11]
MAYRNQRSFIELLEKRGELKRIGYPVSPELEITEIAARLMRSGGPALLFENVRGSRMPLSINLLGSRKRMALALGVEEVEEIASRIEGLLSTKVPESLMGKLALLPRLLDLTRYPPRAVSGGPVQEIVEQGDKVDLGNIPVLTCWPEDGGPYFTLPQVITRDPVSGMRNVGMYRMQVYDRNTTGMHWHIHKHGAHHFEQARRLGQRLEVAVAFGGDPALTYAASAPLPDTIEEYLFAGFLRQEPVDLTRARTVDLEVPAEADLVLEGYVDPAEPLRREGPFGDHTGYYSLADDYPVFHCTAVTRRKDAIYPATVVGPPPMEDYWMGHATERIFLPLLRLVVPEVVDYHMPPEGVFHNLVFISIRKRYPGQAYKVMHALWGQGLMMLAKVLVVVDEQVNVQNPAEAWWAALNNIDPQRDTIFTPGPVDALDHASRLPHYGTKMGLDGTRKLPEEGFTRPWPRKIEMSAEVKRKVDSIWKELGLDG